VIYSNQSPLLFAKTNEDRTVCRKGLYPISRVCYGIMRARSEVNVHFHTNEST